MELILNGANSGTEDTPAVQVDGRVKVFVNDYKLAQFTITHGDCTLSFSSLDASVLGMFPGYERDYGSVYGVETLLEIVVDFYARAKELQAAYDAGIKRGRNTYEDETTGETLSR